MRWDIKFTIVTKKLHKLNDGMTLKTGRAMVSFFNIGTVSGIIEDCNGKKKLWQKTKKKIT